MGVGVPCWAAAVLVVSRPAASRKPHSRGITVLFRLAAWESLPSATVVVAMSSNQRPLPPKPGTATQSGLVPRIAVLPCHGATAGHALLIAMPINPARASFSPHQAPAPK